MSNFVSNFKKPGAAFDFIAMAMIFYVPFMALTALLIFSNPTHWSLTCGAIIAIFYTYFYVVYYVAPAFCESGERPE